MDPPKFVKFDRIGTFQADEAEPCSTSFPSGNLVGGLPLVAHTGEDGIGPAPLPYKCMISTPLIEICS